MGICKPIQSVMSTFYLRPAISTQERFEFAKFVESKYTKTIISMEET